MCIEERTYCARFSPSLIMKYIVVCYTVNKKENIGVKQASALSERWRKKEQVGRNGGLYAGVPMTGVPFLHTCAFCSHNFEKKIISVNVIFVRLQYL